MGDLKQGSNTTCVLLAAIAGSSMSFIDGTAVNVALPVLQRDFGAGAESLQWVVEGYALFLSALILMGGALGDLFGRRRIFGIGVLVFAAASLCCGLAQTIEQLNLFRCLQGVGGALSTPGSLALISANFRGEARGRAIGTWSGFSGITAAGGPVLGGWLVQVASWRYVFFINLPLAALVLLLLFGVRESRDETGDRKLDVPGAALVTAALGALVYGLIRLQSGRFDMAGATIAVAGLALLGLFVWWEARSPDPMLRLELFRSRAFSEANLFTLLVYASLGGSLYFIPFELINVQGYSPTVAGTALLPTILIMFAFSRFSGGLAARVGARLPLAIGAFVAAVAFAVYATAGTEHAYWTVFFPAAIVLGFGGAGFVAPLTTLVMDAVPMAHAGLASGVNNAISRVAGLIAIAALGIALGHTVQAAVSRDLQTERFEASTRATLERNRSAIAAGHVPHIDDERDREQVARDVRAAYAHGFAIVMLIASGLCVLGGVSALAFLTSRPVAPMEAESAASVVAPAGR